MRKSLDDDDCENIEETIKSLTEEYHKLMLLTEEKNNMMLVIQGNAMKRMADEKLDSLGQLKKRKTELEENIMNINA